MKIKTGLAKMLLYAVVAFQGAGYSAFAQEEEDSTSDLPELAIGSVADDVSTRASPSSYLFHADGPGLLTIAVRAKHQDDLTIEVYSHQSNQMLPNGRCDIDFNGNAGYEHMAIPIVTAGDYRIVIEPLGNGGAFWIGASWLPFELLEDALAPAKPEDATPLTPGTPQDGAVSPGGEVEQWYSYTAASEGVVIISTEADHGDLVIEAYHDGQFNDSFEYSDNDRNGSNANERVIAELNQGQTVYFKVRGLNPSYEVEFDVTSQFASFAVDEPEPEQGPQEEGGDDTQEEPAAAEDAAQATDDGDAAPADEAAPPAGGVGR